MAHTEDMTIDEVVGTRVHMAMFTRRVRQTQLSSEIGITQSTLSKKIHGQRPWTLDELAAAARALGVPLADLIPSLEELPQEDSNFQPFDYRFRDDSPFALAA
jgi:transcriptional regulator with XRE-family HTH domain